MSTNVNQFQPILTLCNFWTIVYCFLSSRAHYERGCKQRNENAQFYVWNEMSARLKWSIFCAKWDFNNCLKNFWYSISGQGRAGLGPGQGRMLRPAMRILFLLLVVFQLLQPVEPRNIIHDMKCLYNAQFWGKICGLYQYIPVPDFCRLLNIGDNYLKCMHGTV